MRIPIQGTTRVARIKMRPRTQVAKVVTKNVPVLDVTVEAQRQQMKVEVGEQTLVKKVVVGRPVRRFQQQSGVSIDNLSGVDTTGKVDGSVLVYSTATNNFEATLLLEKQIINGGHY